MKESKSVYVEIGLASGLGAMIGLLFAFRLGIEYWISIPTGALLTAATSFVSYRPWEVKAATVMVAGVLWHGMKTGIHTMMSGMMAGAMQTPQILRTYIPRACKIMIIISCVWVGCGSGIYFLIHEVSQEELPLIGAVIFGVPLAMGATMFPCAMVMGILHIVENSPLPTWSMPLCKKIWGKPSAQPGSSSEKNYEESDPFQNWEEWKNCCFLAFMGLIGLTLTQLWTLFLCLIISYEAVITIIFLCSSNQRIAAVMGGLIGFFTAGSMGYFGILPDTDAFFIGGGIAGTCCGPLLHRIRVWLDEKYPASAATTTA